MRRLKHDAQTPDEGRGRIAAAIVQHPREFVGIVMAAAATLTIFVNALFLQQDPKPLIELARKETDPGLKKDIVSRLSMMKSKEATDYMMEILNK